MTDDTTTPPERPKQTCYGCGALHIPEHLRRDPTVEELQSHTFNAVWDVIKHVDVHFAGGLKSGATGNDVIALLQLTGVAASAHMREDFERECADADRIFTAVGWAVEDYRTEGGSLKVGWIIERLQVAASAPPPANGLVAGDRMERSVGEFERSCSVHIAEEQAKIAPDTSLIGLLCDAVRLSREFVAMATAPIIRRYELAEIIEEVDELLSVRELCDPDCEGRCRVCPLTSANAIRQQLVTLQSATLPPSAAPAAATPVWQPIETAPKDKTLILGWNSSHGARETIWFDNGYQPLWRINGRMDHWYPTHWMPLPVSPSPTPKEAER